MTTLVQQLTNDLESEQAALDAIVEVLDAEQWALPTPSPGWSVADQIGHLSYFDRTAVTAIEDPEQFARRRDELFTAAFGDPTALDELTLGETRAMDPAELIAYWRGGRLLLATAAATLDDSSRVEWYGPSMSAKSFLTARLMETWAHGQDVVDAVGAHRPATDRLFHIAQMGVITRGWSYANRGEEAPPDEVFVELVGPSGAERTWGDPDAASSITGAVEDFCRVVTQRRHVDDTSLVVVGDAARSWMLRAQAFAGAPTDGPTAQGA
ncbi:MAG: TIGR03084 family metal-binding protein [Microthrixaceae bacterium]